MCWPNLLERSNPACIVAYRYYGRRYVRNQTRGIEVMEYNNGNDQHAGMEPPQDESSRAEQSPVPPIPTANVLNRLGIRSASFRDGTGEELVNALNSPETTRRVAALQALGKRAEQGEPWEHLPV